MNQERFDKIKNIIFQLKNDDTIDLTVDTNLVNDGILDSIEIVSFMFEFEEIFDYKFEDHFNDFSIKTLINIVE